MSFRCDMGIVVNPSPHPDLILHHLCSDEVTLWTSSDESDSTNNNFLLCDPDLIQVQTLLKDMKKLNFRFERLMTSNSLEVLRSLTTQGCGVGILPTRVAALAGPNRLKKVTGAPSFRDEIFFAFRVENRNVKTIQLICDYVKNRLVL